MIFSEKLTKDTIISIYDPSYKKIAGNYNNNLISCYVTSFSQNYTLNVVKILYYIGFIPFRFKRAKNVDDGHFEWRIHTNICQKVCKLFFKLINFKN